MTNIFQISNKKHENMILVDNSKQALNTKNASILKNKKNYIEHNDHN